MAKPVYFTTGNSIVDEVTKMNITGNVIASLWHKTIVNAKGKTSSNAMLILAEIVYWYKAAEKREEGSNEIRYVKKFKDDKYLQKSYEELCSKFNLSKKQVRECLIMLESLGVIKRHFRDVKTNAGVLHNVLYIELIPDVLYQLTYPNSDLPNDHSDMYHSQKDNISFQKRNDIFPKKETYPSPKDNTYTKNTTEITTKITTSPSPSEIVPVKDTEKGEREQYKQLIANNINLDSFLQGFDGIDPDRVRMIYDIMVDTICSKAKTIRINSENMSKEVVKSVFLKLGFEEISYVCAVLDEPKEERIGNLPGYIRTLLYNSLHLAKEYWSQRVNYDQFGGGSNNSKMEDLRKKHGFKQRDDIDFDELERKLIRN